MPPDPGLTPATGPQPAQIQSRPPQVRFHVDQVPPSQYLYLQDNDFLAFTFFTNAAPQTLQLTYRFLTPQGEIKQGTSIFTLAGAINSFNFTLGECWLISFGLQRTSGGNQSVITFAQALIIRDQNTGTGQNIYGTIWQGFVQVSSGNGWPGTPSKELLDGSGNIRTIQGTTPAAGADISETVPNNRRWKLLGLRASLTTSATVANRFGRIGFDDGTGIISFLAGSSLVQTATQSNTYEVGPGTQFFNDTQSSLILTWPSELFFRGGYRIKTFTVGLQATDQWTAPSYTVLEWGSWDT